MKQVAVIERKNLQTVLQEKALGQSGVLDQSEIQSVGNILGADAILVGEVLDYGKVITPAAKLDSRRQAHCQLTRWHRVNPSRLPDAMLAWPSPQAE